ncbi:hypothetical protein N008_11950 [Hymenobacter sp. APR13]|nr:hypothetical protein N008_11950 [Hymenobacter sp. APR13]
MGVGGPQHITLRQQSRQRGGGGAVAQLVPTHHQMAQPRRQPQPRQRPAVRRGFQ